MSFISYSLNYYEKELKLLETTSVSAANIYKAKQLLKMLDDLVDEGYTELSEKLEGACQGVSRLRKFLKENGAEPFMMWRKELSESKLSYEDSEVELLSAIDELMRKAGSCISVADFKNAGQEYFLQELRQFCEWIGYEENTAYIFLLRDTLLPYVYYRDKKRNAIYPWLIGRKTLEQLTGKCGVDDEIRAAIIQALEEGRCGSFQEFCEGVFPDIRRTLSKYPELKQCLKALLEEIKEQRIVVVESGCSGTFPMLLMSLDERIDMRMYTTYPYLADVYGARIFTLKYEENRLFETMVSQDLYLQFSDLRDGNFFVKKCRNAEVEEGALTEVKTVLE